MTIMVVGFICSEEKDQASPPGFHLLHKFVCAGLMSFAFKTPFFFHKRYAQIKWLTPVFCVILWEFMNTPLSYLIKPFG